MLLCEKVKKEIFSQKIYFVKIRDIWTVGWKYSLKYKFVQYYVFIKN